jgi:hypothetical protein
MIQQSSALRRLEEVLTNAVDNGDVSEPSGLILLKAMSLQIQPHNIMDFYGLLNKAEGEAQRVRTIKNIDRYLGAINQLHEQFITNHVWTTKWQTFAAYVRNTNVLSMIDSLAEFFSLENPAISLDKDFMEQLSSEFTLLTAKILQSDLPGEIKRLLVGHVESILTAINRYQIDGTEGLKKSAQALVSDLVMTEHSLEDVDKKNPTYTCIKAWGIGILLFITPSLYDVISVIPDIHEFWIPKFEEISTGHKKIEKICESSTIQEAFEKASDTFNRQQQKTIGGGKDVKALPPSGNNRESKE